MLENIETVVAIVGCQRSGTTLTGQILGAHPNALLIDETDGLYQWFDQIQSNKTDTDSTKSIFRKADKKYTSNNKRLKQSSTPSSEGENSFELSSQVTHLVLKAPNLTYSFSSLANLDIPVKVVYPVRDARAVVSSMEKLSHIPFVENQIRWINKSDVIAKRFANELVELSSSKISDNEKRTIVWKIKTGLASDFSNAGLPVNLFLYEQLIYNSEEIVSQLARFTGLPLSDSMLAHENIYVGLGPGGTERFRPIDGQSLSKWSKIMSSETEAEILRIGSPLLNSLGYCGSPVC